MSDPIKFAASCESFNARLAAKERELAALVAERDILLETARSSGVMVKAAAKMLGKLQFTVTMPEGWQVPAAAPEKAPEIVRHSEQAAE